jgi:hypothetical protein
MDLQRGSIASRDDFFRVLAEVQEFMRRLLGYSPDEPTLRSIAGQLEAMRRWTAEGRTPRPEERRSLDFGARGARELGAGDAALEALAHKLFALQDYFASWPGDEHLAPAATPTAVPPQLPTLGASVASWIRGAYQRAFGCA